jgi:hypothetical protein
MSLATQHRVDAPPARGGWLTGAIAVVSVLVTLGAISLAGVAPFFATGAHPSGQSGWTRVYDRELTAASSEWDLPGGCQITAQGIDVVAQGEQVLCTYKPSAETDYLGSGFQLDLTVAPAGAVAGTEQAFVVLGNQVLLLVDQSGSFEMCEGSCTSRSQSTASGSTITWHSGGFTPNIITLKSQGTGQPLEFYANGQLITSVPFSYESSQPTIQIGTDRGAEALFTHMTLTSATTA